MKKSTTIPFEVIERFALRNDISLETSILLHEKLVAFLDLDGNNSPNPLIDEVWHSFILHTKLYRSFCEERYGKFIEHIPTSLKSNGDGKILKLLNNKRNFENIVIDNLVAVTDCKSCGSSGDEDTSGDASCTSQGEDQGSCESEGGGYG